MNDSNFDDLIDLLEYNYFNDIEECETTENNDFKDEVEALESDRDSQKETTIEDIRVARVQFNTNCFEIFYNDETSECISYLMIINNIKYTPEKLFNVGYRNSIHKDIRSVKQEYVNKNSVKGQVKCQETGLSSKWVELVVDHRQSYCLLIFRT